MPFVRDILSTKGDKVHSIDPAASVLDATHKMNQHSIGALVVIQAGRLQGIFTERDVLRRVVGEQKNPSTTRVRDVMTTEIVCCDPESDLDEVSAIMKKRRIRHLPVCDSAGNLFGMISIGDLNAVYASEQESQIQFLNEYVYGRT